MAKRIGLSDTDKWSIVNGYNRGATQEFLATVHGCSRKTIYRVLVEHSVITPRNHEEILKLLKKHNIGLKFLKELLEG